MRKCEKLSRITQKVGWMLGEQAQNLIQGSTD